MSSPRALLHSALFIGSLYDKVLRQRSMQAETLLSPSVSVASGQSVQGVVDRIVRGLSKRSELAAPASGSFGPAIFATHALCVQIGAGSLPTHRSSRCVIHFPRRRLGLAEFFSRRWLDHAVRSLLRCVLFLLLGLNSLWAVDPSRHISQYAHTACRILDGIFSGRPTVISHTPVGHHWI